VSPSDDQQPVTPSRRLAMRRSLVGAAAVAVLGLGLMACSNDDDGADVRSSGPGACESGSASASGSASGSTSASAASGSEASASGSEECPSGSASGSASGSEAAAECEVIDGTAGVEDAADTTSVTLDEFSVALDPSDLAAGSVGFAAENAGEEPHELVIARTTPDQIEVVDGAPDEAALGDAVIGELEAFAGGGTCDGTFELTAGDYVAFCALVEEEDDGTLESHYEEGMVTTFTVS
jgi:hypothetical protein